jgi:hypothetical protein
LLLLWDLLRIRNKAIDGINWHSVWCEICNIRQYNKKMLLVIDQVDCLAKSNDLNDLIMLLSLLLLQRDEKSQKSERHPYWMNTARHEISSKSPRVASWHRSTELREYSKTAIGLNSSWASTSPANLLSIITAIHQALQKIQTQHQRSRPCTTHNHNSYQPVGPTFRSISYTSHVRNIRMAHDL